MGKSASDSAHGSAWWWIFDAFLCLSVSIPSINHPIWNFRKTIQHRVPIFHIDKSCEQKKRLLPLNPAKILEEGEGNKGTEWTPDWFSPSWTAWLCCLPMVHKLQSKHISEETSDRDRLTQGDSSSPFFGYKTSSFLGGFSCRASQPNSTKALSTEFTSSPCQLWNLIILINKIPKTNEDISQ